MQAASFAQTNATTQVVLIKAGRLIDVRAGRMLENQAILIEGERIKTVGPLAEIEQRTTAWARRLPHSHLVTGRHYGSRLRRAASKRVHPIPYDSRHRRGAHSPS